MPPPRRLPTACSATAWTTKYRAFLLPTALRLVYLRPSPWGRRPAPRVETSSWHTCWGGRCRGVCEPPERGREQACLRGSSARRGGAHRRRRRRCQNAAAEYSANQDGPGYRSFQSRRPDGQHGYHQPVTHPGNAARMGVEAALLARAGFTGHPDVLEASSGYADALFSRGMDWDVLTWGLGTGFVPRIVDPGFHIKRFPAQISMQWLTEAVLDLRAAHGSAPGAGGQQSAVESATEGTERPVPTTGLDGKFSPQDRAAAALLDGRVNIETFTDERRFSPDSTWKRCFERCALCPGKATAPGPRPATAERRAHRERGVPPFPGLRRQPTQS